MRGYCVVGVLSDLIAAGPENPAAVVQVSYGIKLKTCGPYACFTRPEMKVERVSYDVMTPSAARGILESPLMQGTDNRTWPCACHAQTHITARIISPAI